MKKEFFNVKNIFASLSILFAVYMIFTTKFYNGSSDFNYRDLIFFLAIIVIGIVQLFQRNEPIDKRRFKMLFWAVLVVAFVIFILTVINQKEQIKKLEKAEHSKNAVK